MGLSGPKGSINRHLVDGVSANAYFSPKLIKEALVNDKAITFSKDKPVLHQADDMIQNGHKQASKVYKIIYHFGLRLAKILYLFESPSENQKKHRTDYDANDWLFLKAIKTIYLAGGLLTESFTPIFKKATNDYFSKHPFDKRIVFMENSSHLALEGLAKKSLNDALIYDFGQTNVKNGLYKLKHLSIFKPIDVHIPYHQDKQRYAKETDDFIYGIVYEHLKAHKDINHVHMAISNYLTDGLICPAPWCYGILYYLNPDYKQHIQDRLSQALDRQINVNLYHDTTAMAYALEKQDHAMLISLGTAFGVAYF